jgi:hypothetical protein
MANTSTQECKTIKLEFIKNHPEKISGQDSSQSEVPSLTKRKREGQLLAKIKNKLQLNIKMKNFANNIFRINPITSQAKKRKAIHKLKQVIPMWTLLTKNKDLVYPI